LRASLTACGSRHVAGIKTQACLIVAAVHAFLPPVLRGCCRKVEGFRIFEIK
jgi:hypothetical protein